MSIIKSKQFEKFQEKEFDHYFSTIDINESRALQIEFKTLIEFMGDISGKRILDLGCGIGRNGIQLASYADEVVGYDLSSVAVDRANNTAQQLGITNFVACVNNFSNPAHNDFDIVLCVNMLHHADSPQHVLNTIYKVLRPGGQLIIMENNPMNPLFPFFFVMIGQLKSHLTMQYLTVNRFVLTKSLIKSGLALVNIQRYGFLPTVLYNFSLAFKKLNEFLNRIPLLNEFTAFYMIKAIKPISEKQ